MTEPVRLRRALLGVYAVVLLVATLAPLPSTAYEVVTTTPGSDKVVHFVLFGGFAVALHWNLNRVAAFGWVVAVAAAALLAAVVELLQAPLVYRSGDVWDFVWGVFGAVVAAVLVAGVARVRRAG